MTSSKYPWSSRVVSRGDIIINMRFLAELFADHCSLPREARTKEDAEHKGIANFLLYTFQFDCLYYHLSVVNISLWLPLIESIIANFLLYTFEFDHFQGVFNLITKNI